MHFAGVARVTAWFRGHVQVCTEEGTEIPGRAGPQGRADSTGTPPGLRRFSTVEVNCCLRKLSFRTLRPHLSELLPGLHSLGFVRLRRRPHVTPHSCSSWVCSLWGRWNVSRQAAGQLLPAIPPPALVGTRTGVLRKEHK